MRNNRSCRTTLGFLPVFLGLIMILSGCSAPRPTDRQDVLIEWQDPLSGKSESITGIYYPANVDNAPLIVISGYFYEETYWEQLGYVGWLTDNDSLTLTEEDNLQSKFPALPDGISYAVFTFSPYDYADSSYNLILSHTAAMQTALKLPGINSKSIITLDMQSSFLYNECQRNSDSCSGALMVFPVSADQISYGIGLSGKPVWCIGILSEYPGEACAPCESAACISTNIPNRKEYIDTQLSTTIRDFLAAIK
jgi:hypothetical protein